MGSDHERGDHERDSGTSTGSVDESRASRSDHERDSGTSTGSVDKSQSDHERPFRILGVQQIAIGGLDLDKLRVLWVDTLGVEQVGEYTSESENVNEDILRVGDGAGAVEIDLMRPLDPDGRPRVHEPALNHIGLWVDDLAGAVGWLSERGVRFTPGGIRRGAGGHDVTFIHPKANDEFPIGGAGVLIELVQAPEELLP